MTMIYMFRQRLITKEDMEDFCNGKYHRKESVNDDLEKLFEDIQLGKEPNRRARTYFLPKLSKEELDLVERKDADFMKTFEWEMGADVNKAKMMLSESDSKFVRGLGWRKTFVIENKLQETRSEESIENQPPHKKLRLVMETANM